MPSIYELKPAFQSVLRPAVRSLVALGVRPNHITLLALTGSAVSGLFVLRAAHDPRWLLLLPAWLLVRMALNAMDGMAAREHGMQSRLGGALNEVSDVLSDVALYLPLVVLGRDLLWPVLGFVLGSVFAEFCGVLGPALGAPRQYQGPMGKSDRALAVGLFALVGGLTPLPVSWWSTALTIGFVLTLWTAWNRIRGALRCGPAAPAPPGASS